MQRTVLSMEGGPSYCWLLAVALASCLAVMVESCPTAVSVSPASGSADPSFVYTISGAGLTDVNVTSPAGSLNYTAVNDSTIRFSFETGSSARGRVMVRLTATLCSAVDVTVLVTIPFAPILEGASEGVIQLSLNSTGSIACNILGSTSAPAWYYNNVPLVSGDGRTLQNDSIKFDRLLSRHAGWYTCAAANQYGRTERDYLVLVVAAPTFLVRPLPTSGRSSFEVLLGSTVILPCAGYGIPPPTVRWFFNGRALDTGKVYQIELITSSLIIPNYNEIDGNFSCSLQNTMGTIESDDVIVQSILTPPADDFSLSTLNSTYKISSNEQVTLNCYTNTSQSRFFQWYKNSEIIDGATNATLTVAGSSSGDAWGHYCCRIKSSAKILESITLDTRCAVVIVNLESQLDVSPPTSVSLPTGRSVSLLCSGSTMNRINLPQFNWTRNSTTIPAGLIRIPVQQSRYAISTLLVRDTQLGDSGTYRCSGMNSANSVTASTQVMIADVCNGSASLLAGPEEIGLTEDYVTEINGEICFVISDFDTVLEYDPKDININVTQQIHFSARMRAESGSSLRPLVTLMITDKQPIDITLPFPSSTAWQWVGHKVQIDVANNNIVPRLKVKITTTGSTDSMGPVYFDDICLTLSGITQPPPTLVAPSPVVVSSPTMTPTIESTVVWTNIVIAVSLSGGSALLIMVAISAVLFVCGCVYRSKSKERRKQLADRYSARFEKDNGYSETVTLNAVNPSATPVQSVPASPSSPLPPPGPVTKNHSASSSSLAPGTPVKGAPPSGPTTPQPRPSIASGASTSSNPFLSRPAPSPPTSPTNPLTESGYEAIDDDNRVKSLTEDAYEAICPSDESVHNTPTTPRQFVAVLKHSASKSSIASLPNSRPITPSVPIPAAKEGTYLSIMPNTAPVTARPTRANTTDGVLYPASVENNYEAITPPSSTSPNPLASRPAPIPPPSSPSTAGTSPISPTVENDYMAISPPTSATTKLLPDKNKSMSSLPIPSAKEDGYVAINPSNRESANIYSLPVEDEYSYVSTSEMFTSAELEKKASKTHLLTANDEDHIYY